MFASFYYYRLRGTRPWFMIEVARPMPWYELRSIICSHERITQLRMTQSSGSGRLQYTARDVQTGAVFEALDEVPLLSILEVASTFTMFLPPPEYHPYAFSEGERLAENLLFAPLRRFVPLYYHPTDILWITWLPTFNRKSLELLKEARKRWDPSEEPEYWRELAEKYPRVETPDPVAHAAVVRELLSHFAAP